MFDPELSEPQMLAGNGECFGGALFVPARPAEQRLEIAAASADVYEPTTLLSQLSFDDRP